MLRKLRYLFFATFLTCVTFLTSLTSIFAQDAVKEPNVAGAFYPSDPGELAAMVDKFIQDANPEPVPGEIFALISPHAGYVYSGQTAAYGYKLIKDRPYKTVIVIAPSHRYGFRGISVYPEGKFRTPLGDIEIDGEFTQKLLNKDDGVFFDARAFSQEHALEVQLPFLQSSLSGFKIVPIIMGDSDFASCAKLAGLLKEAIAGRKDVLVIASSDMYHGYDYEEAEAVDKLTVLCLENMDAQGLYNGLGEGRLQLCGGFGVVVTLILSKELGHDKIKALKYTNSAEVTANKTKGIWTVGYLSAVIDQQKKEAEMAMLNKDQRQKLLKIARRSIETYLETGKKLEVGEEEAALNKEMGAFVTLRKQGDLRGCIGNLIGDKPLYITVRDMAVEAAVDDPRFSPVKLPELKDIEIEISALSPMQRAASADEIKMGTHGVLIRRGYRSGVYLPQVAAETGWGKEEFLSSLCAHKAGLPADAWKDSSTEIYTFTAEVFSEKDY